MIEMDPSTYSDGRKTFDQTLNMACQLACQSQDAVSFCFNYITLVVLPTMTEADLLAVKKEYSQKIDEAF
jgi:hypothetical protein